MKPKSKLFTAVLLGCALVLAFAASAGCIFGSDPIVGTYLESYPDGDVIQEFQSEGTYYTTFVYNDGRVNRYGPFSWKKTGDNRYESGTFIFKLSDDTYTLYETLKDGKTNKYTRYSNYTVPSPTNT